MKRIATILVLFLFALNAYTQTDSDRAAWVASLFEGSVQPSVEGKNRITTFDFGPLWTRLDDKKPASWGDSRIPLSGDLDIGAGEFSPDEKFIPSGWKSYRDAYSRQDNRALVEEKRQWWE